MSAVEDTYTEHTGPIIACQNAMDHYNKQAEIAQHNIDKAERELVRWKAELHTYQVMYQQWLDAKVALTDYQKLKDWSKTK